MSKIFVSYRRSDSEFATHQICSELKRAFGKDNVFVDLDDLHPGVVFPDEILKAIKASSVMIIIIGNKWTDARDDHGNLRLHDEADYVRIEIENGLKEQLHIIPVLLGTTPMPTSASLPQSLHNIQFRHALKIGLDANFDDDTARLAFSISAYFSNLTLEKKIRRPSHKIGDPSADAPSKPVITNDPEWKCPKCNLTNYIRHQRVDGIEKCLSCKTLYRIPVKNSNVPALAPDREPLDSAAVTRENAAPDAVEWSWRCDHCNSTNYLSRYLAGMVETCGGCRKKYELNRNEVVERPNGSFTQVPKPATAPKNVLALNATAVLKQDVQPPKEPHKEPGTFWESLLVAFFASLVLFIIHYATTSYLVYPRHQWYGFTLKYIVVTFAPYFVAVFLMIYTESSKHSMLREPAVFIFYVLMTILTISVVLSSIVAAYSTIIYIADAWRSFYLQDTSV